MQKQKQEALHFDNWVEPDGHQHSIMHTHNVTGGCWEKTALCCKIGKEQMVLYGKKILNYQRLTGQPEY